MEETKNEENVKTVTAEDIDNMTDEQFAEYIAAMRDENEYGAGGAADTGDASAEAAEDEPEADTPSGSSAAVGPFVQARTEADDTAEGAEGDVQPEEKNPPEDSAAKALQNVPEPSNNTVNTAAAAKAPQYSPKPYASPDSGPDIDFDTAVADEYYGGKESNPRARTSEDMIKEMAEERKVEPDVIRRQIESNIKARKYDAMQEESTKRQKLIDAQIADWQRQADVVKEFDPEFDYAKALPDPVFAKALQETGSVAKAYKAMKQSGQDKPKKEAPKQEKPEPRKEVKQVARTEKHAGTKGRTDPSALSEKDFAAYIEKCRNK